jgi:hypothetical protein
MSRRALRSRSVIRMARVASSIAGCTVVPKAFSPGLPNWPSCCCAFAPICASCCSAAWNSRTCAM